MWPDTAWVYIQLQEETSCWGKHIPLTLECSCRGTKLGKDASTHQGELPAWAMDITIVPFPTTLPTTHYTPCAL